MVYLFNSSEINNAVELLSSNSDRAVYKGFALLKAPSIFMLPGYMTRLIMPGKFQLAMA